MLSVTAVASSRCSRQRPRPSAPGTRGPRRTGGARSGLSGQRPSTRPRRAWCTRSVPALRAPARARRGSPRRPGGTPRPGGAAPPAAFPAGPEWAGRRVHAASGPSRGRWQRPRQSTGPAPRRRGRLGGGLSARSCAGAKNPGPAPPPGFRPRDTAPGQGGCHPRGGLPGSSDVSDQLAPPPRRGQRRSGVGRGAAPRPRRPLSGEDAERGRRSMAAQRVPRRPRRVP